MSKTDLPNSWLPKPKKAARCDSKTFSDFFPSHKPDYRATSKDFTPNDLEFIHDQLSQLSN